MPRKKPSKRYKLHGWSRHVENSENLAKRLSKEFGIQKQPNDFWAEPHKKNRD